MVVFRSVPLLEDLAVEVAFMEIIRNLVLCRDHLPENPSENSYKANDWVSSSSFLSTHPFMSSENVLKFVKRRLNEYLVGIMGIKIRYIFIILYDFTFLIVNIFFYLEPNMLKGSPSYLTLILTMNQ